MEWLKTRLFTEVVIISRSDKDSMYNSYLGFIIKSSIVIRWSLNKDSLHFTSSFNQLNIHNNLTSKTPASFLEGSVSDILVLLL